MNTITTTNLRTQSSLVVDLLKKGSVISLIHRSKIIGVLKPQREPKALTKTDIKQIKNLANNLALPKLSYEDRDKAYRKRLLETYGKNFS